MYIPFLSTTFPAPAGAFATGYATLRFPAVRPYAAPTPLRADDGTPALQLTESVMSVYYPTTPTGAAPGAPWLPDDPEAQVEGLNRYLQGRLGSWSWWIACKVLGRARMPVYPLAPLAPREEPYPLVLFSHGMVGTRTTYSQFCSALASEGYVVIAVEHADGSGPAVVRKGKTWPFLKFMETAWEGRTNVMPADVPHTEMTPKHVTMLELRAAQLDLRVREVYDAYEAFAGMVGTPTATSATETSPATVDGVSDPAPFLASFRGRVDASNLQIAGHSFGAGTLLRLLTTPVPEGYSPLPAKHAVLLDPWVEPFEVAKSLPPASIPAPPTLVINSQGFTEHDQFPEQLRLCRAIAGTFVTITGLQHQGFSDYGLLTPDTWARSYLSTINALTLGQFTDTLAAVPGMQAAADGGKVPFSADGKLVAPAKNEILVQLKSE